VLLIVREFEEVMKLMEEKDTEELKAAKKKKRADNVLKQKQEQELAKAQFDKQQAEFKRILELLFACQFVLPGVPSDVVPSENQLALKQFVKLAFGVGSPFNESLPVDMATFIDNGLGNLNSFLAGSDAEALMEVSFKTLSEDLEKIFQFIRNPPPEPQFTVDDGEEKIEVSSMLAEQNSEARFAPSEYSVDGTSLHDVQVQNGASNLANGYHGAKLSFMTPSNIFEDPAIVSATVHQQQNPAHFPAAPSSYEEAESEGQKISFQTSVEIIEQPSLSTEEENNSVIQEGEAAQEKGVEAAGKDEKKQRRGGYRGGFRGRGGARGGFQNNGGSFRGGRGRSGRGGFRGQQQAQQQKAE
jgi:uncharacterized membrane protein YgcG